MSDRRSVEFFATQKVLGFSCFYWRRANIGQPDSHFLAGAIAIQSQLGGDGGRGKVSDLAFQLKVGPAATRGWNWYSDFGEDFIVLQRRAKKREEEILDGYDSLALRSRCDDTACAQ